MLDMRFSLPTFLRRSIAVLAAGAWVFTLSSMGRLSARATKERPVFAEVDEPAPEPPAEPEPEREPEPDPEPTAVPDLPTPRPTRRHPLEVKQACNGRYKSNAFARLL